MAVMNLHRCLRFLVLFTGLIGAPPVTLAQQPEPKRPNIVLIVADYMGYSDTEPYGATDVRTPYLKRLAAEGIRFTDAYASAPVCVPSRAALLTGLYQQRLGLEGNADEKKGLPASHRTVAERLQTAGYRTGMIGKWHLGFGPGAGPNARGFDTSLAFNSWSIDYYSHRTPAGEPGLFEDGRPVEISGYSTDVFTARAVDFIQSQASRPFFLYLAYNATLPPRQPPGRPSDVRAMGPGNVPMAEWHRGTREDYIAVVESLDAGIGRILETIERKGVRDSTLIIFTYDHGGRELARNAPLFHGFATLWEGGIRVPLILCWPSRLAPGHVSAQQTILMDVAATILAAAGVEPQGAAKLDGVNLLPLLGDGAAVKERAFFWRLKFPGREQKAVRRGRWKLIEDGNTPLLFDLEEDISERRDLRYAYPAVVRDLREAYRAWERDLQTQER
jgi:arylsulfatase A-like enzyme